MKSWKTGKQDSKENKALVNLKYRSFHFDVFLLYVALGVVHHLDVVLMLLFGYGAMWCLELCLVLTQADGWTGCS